MRLSSNFGKMSWGRVTRKVTLIITQNRIPKIISDHKKRKRWRQPIPDTPNNICFTMCQLKNWAKTFAIKALVTCTHMWVNLHCCCGFLGSSGPWTVIERSSWILRPPEETSWNWNVPLSSVCHVYCEVFVRLTKWWCSDDVDVWSPYFRPAQ